MHKVLVTMHEQESTAIIDEMARFAWRFVMKMNGRLLVPNTRNSI